MSTKSFHLIGFKTKLGAEINGINVTEANRATEYVRTKSDIEILQKILSDNYLGKGVKAVLAGIPRGKQQRYEYAVFVTDGFLIEVPPEKP